MSKLYKKDVGAIVRKSGVSFRVWAPFADSVAVTGTFNDWAETPLTSEDDGYWWAFVRGAIAGHEYKFVIHNGDKVLRRNDPRALHFTTSAGTSVIADPNFDWGDSVFVPPPVEKQVIYELHVGTFNRPDASTVGTFQDVIDKLDYLADLGVNMIELMPIGSMLMDRGWGYAIDYIYAVETLYGGRYGFLKFVKAAHDRGIGVILDVVYNHFGPDSSLDLWQFDGWQKDDMGGIYFYNDWRAVTPWGNTRPDFARPEIQQYILDNVRMWMHDCRLDGLRVDSTIYIRNVNGFNDDPSTDIPEGWLLLQKANTLVKKINPNALTIAEDVAGNEYITKSSSDGGAGFSAQWELNFPHVLRESLASDNVDNINLAGISGLLGRRYNDDAFQRVIYSDSHDSAANGSSRLNEVISPGKADNLFARKQALIAAGILLTSPGIPMLFQGQEFMESGYFNDWKALDWTKSERFKGTVEAYKHLIDLRQNVHGLSEGLQGKSVNIIQLDEANKVLAYHRWKNGGPKDDVIIIINFANQAHQEYYLNFPRNGSWRVRFNSSWSGYSPDFDHVDVPDIIVESGGASIVVPASSVIVLSQD